ncbi:MAG: DUF924 family protein [Pseudomonadota bacterium]|nr:DUF924 family protein [Pseudomonadota bacterium]
MADKLTLAAQVVDFWRGAGADLWYAKNLEFDARCRDGWLDLHMEVAARRREDWQGDAIGALALVLLTDQIPRNVFRGTAHMFATDPLARIYAGHALAAGYIGEVEPQLRVFFLLPFEHSEALADQARSVALHRLWAPHAQSYADGHCDIVRRFGRFPHRNAALGRETTPEEAAFLAQGGFDG